MFFTMTIRKAEEKDIKAITAIWNEIVREGSAFPQDKELSEEEAYSFFSSQSFTAVADDEGTIVGLYILHPNNVGRCGHIANASYAVKAEMRNRHIGRALVEHSLIKAGELGFRILQYNAVVRTNTSARKLYESLGFVPLGIIPGGFRMDDGHYEDIVPYIHLL